MENKKSKIKNQKSKMVLLIVGFTVLTSYSGQWEVFTSKNDVQDIALSSNGNTLWAATTGGVVAWNLKDNSYKSYTTADGLLSCKINHIAIDIKGRPWVATGDTNKLCIYENNTWKEIKINGTNNVIKKTTIYDLEVDRFGNVWVCTNFGWERTYIDHKVVWRYDGRTWHKHKGVYGPLGLDPQKNLLAVDSLIDDKGDAVGTIQFRIVSFNGSEFVSKWRRKAEHFYIGLAYIALDSKGNTWISYCNERSGSTFGVVCNNTIYNTLDGLADDNIRGITTDESGIVWCATDSGISKFNGYGWVSYDTKNGVASNLVNKILTDNNGTLYAAASKGISILKSNQWKTLKIINEPQRFDYSELIVDRSDAVILVGRRFITIYKDLQWKNKYFGNTHIRYSSYYKSFFKSIDGTLYAIGSEFEKSAKGYEIEKGQCILKQGTEGGTFVKASSHIFYKTNRIDFPVVVCSGNDSCFWINGANGLILLNNQKTEIYSPSRFGIKGRNPGISSMLLDRDGRSVWVGYNTSNFVDSTGLVNSIGIVVHFDGDTIKKRINIIKGDVVDRVTVTAIARDSSENLWFASSARYQNGGVSVFLHDTKLTSYLKDSNGKEFGNCYRLFVDKSGMVWVAAANGIARFNGSSWKLFDSSVVSPDLPYQPASQIFQDKTGTVWFSTYNRGLIAYKNKRWYQFTTRNGLPHNWIRSCALDSKDNLWVLTDYGIAKRKPGGMVHNHNQTRRDLISPKNKLEVKQIGNMFYVNSKDKPNMICYTLFDLRGRVVLRHTVHNRRSFVLSKENFRFGSGLRILSIIIENKNGSQNQKLMIIDF